MLIVLLDMSAVFNTVDLNELYSRLKAMFGLPGGAYEWFQSYFVQYSQRVFVHGILSDVLSLVYDVSETSSLDPLVFTIYRCQCCHYMLFILQDTFLYYLTINWGFMY